MPHADRPPSSRLFPRDVWRATATIARFTFAEALHSRVFFVTALIIAVGMGMGQMVGELALTDSRGIGAASQAWLFRLSAAFLAAGFAVTTLVREANDKGLELMLSLPMPRGTYLAGKWLGCMLCCALLAALFALPLLLTAPALAVTAWMLSLFLELALVISASLLCALTFTHVVASLAAVTAFYALSRAMAAVLAMGASATAPVHSPAFQFATKALDMIATLLPRLDQFSRTEWLIGSTAPWTEMPWLAGQTALYCTLLLSAAFIDLMRKSV